MLAIGERKSRRSLARKVARGLLMAMAIALACLCAVAGVLVMWSYPGRPMPYVDKGGNPVSGSI